MSPALSTLSDQDLGELQRRTFLALLCYRHDLEELCLHRGVVLAAYLLENFSCFVIPAHRCKEAGAIRKHLNSGKQQESWKALESEQESPADVRVSIVDEGKPKA